MPTVSAHVAHTLAAHVDHVFGVMGNGNAYFLDALERGTGATFTAVRHEAGGGHGSGSPWAVVGCGAVGSDQCSEPRAAVATRLGPVFPSPQTHRWRPASAP